MPSRVREDSCGESLTLQSRCNAASQSLIWVGLAEEQQAFTLALVDYINMATPDAGEGRIRPLQSYEARSVPLRNPDPSNVLFLSTMKTRLVCAKDRRCTCQPLDLTTSSVQLVSSGPQPQNDPHERRRPFPDQILVRRRMSLKTSLDGLLTIQYCGHMTVCVRRQISSRSYPIPVIARFKDEISTPLQQTDCFGRWCLHG